MAESRIDSGHTVSSDALLACLIPLMLFFTSFQLLGRPSFTDLRTLVADIVYGKRPAPPQFSVQRAILSYNQYAQLSQVELASMRSSYGRLGRAHKRVGYELGYPKKLDRLQEAIKTNAHVTQSIARLAENEQRANVQRLGTTAMGVHGDLSRVRESLRHFVRDWSEEGKDERAKIFGPIIDILKEVVPARRGAMKVLVPGSGLGRLAWEISGLGELISRRMSVELT